MPATNSTSPVRRRGRHIAPRRPALSALDHGLRQVSLRVQMRQPRHIEARQAGHAMPLRARLGIVLCLAAIACAAINGVVSWVWFDPVKPPVLLTSWAVLGVALILGGVVLLLSVEDQEVTSGQLDAECDL
ncbi:Uncharacterised protein [Actinomyces bovis]|uniref:Uncharacterized protein n=1 Tax=Actinomyces bovis TaxID=1658 RepID=A0ABY1VNT7_9ACTO|nr:hypothetical protein [Actinomyces bovis]SPT53775.1 Uncharacterised protein [Actinomyces bovis]VEG53122.1 Uncharacterised protein [Actinomyces israelii]